MKGQIRRIDALAKVKGKAIYAADLRLEKMLYLKVLRSAYSHAIIKNIDVSEALKVPGVKLVLTAQDVPGVNCQDKERPMLAIDRVRYRGDGVALVAAETTESAAAALKLIKVSYEPLPEIYDPAEALKPGAIAIHGTSNELGRHKVRKGNIEEGFAKADVIIQRRYETSRVQHCAIEPEACLTQMEGADKIVVFCPCKSPFNVRRMVAEALNLKLSQVRVVQTVVGGSFGGKDSDMGIMAARAALVTWRTGRPAKMVYTREESIIEGTKRHPYIMNYKVGATKEGRLCAMEIDIVADAGAYKGKTPLVTWRSAVEATGPYEVPHVKTDIVAAYTNTPVSDALRGFGSPQVNFGIELLMDELALMLDIDPAELRRNNAVQDGSISATGQLLQDVGVSECLEQVTKQADWSNKIAEIKIYNEKQKSKGKLGKRRGIGIACCYRGSALGAGGEGLDAAGAVVSIQKDASVLISCGIGEMGQGFQTVAARIVKEILAVPEETIFYNSLDTSVIPDSGPTVASRGTSLGGSAVIIAAEKVKKTMAEVAAEYLQVPVERIVFVPGKVADSENLEKAISFEDLVKLCLSKEKSLYGFGWYSAPRVWWDGEKGCGDAYFSYTYAADIAEVEVDLATGKVEVLNFYAAHDVGNAISPREVKGQIGGGVAMGIGYALLEEVELKQGATANPNLDGYLLPTAADTGTIHPIIVECKDRHGPFGAKGLGEPATQIVAPAIVNAVCNALGTRFYKLPLSLELVYDEIQNRISPCEREM